MVDRQISPVRSFVEDGMSERSLHAIEVNVCVCVWTCVWDRERERQYEHVCVFLQLLSPASTNCHRDSMSPSVKTRNSWSSRLGSHTSWRLLSRVSSRYWLQSSMAFHRAQHQRRYQRCRCWRCSRWHHTVNSSRALTLRCLNHDKQNFKHSSPP